MARGAQHLRGQAGAHRAGPVLPTDTRQKHSQGWCSSRGTRAASGLEHPSRRFPGAGGSAARTGPLRTARPLHHGPRVLPGPRGPLLHALVPAAASACVFTLPVQRPNTRQGDTKQSTTCVTGRGAWARGLPHIRVPRRDLVPAPWAGGRNFLRPHRKRWESSSRSGTGGGSASWARGGWTRGLPGVPLLGLGNRPSDSSPRLHCNSQRSCTVKHELFRKL